MILFLSITASFLIYPPILFLNVILRVFQNFLTNVRYQSLVFWNSLSHLFKIPYLPSPFVYDLAPLVCEAGWGRDEYTSFLRLCLLMARKSLIPLWCSFWMCATRGCPGCWYSTSMVLPSWRTFYLYWTCQLFRLPHNLHDPSHEGVNTTGVFCNILWVSHGLWIVVTIFPRHAIQYPLHIWAALSVLWSLSFSRR